MGRGTDLFLPDQRKRETKAVSFTDLSELLTSKRKITQADFEKMDGVVFRWHEFSPEKVLTPPKDVTAMDTKTVTAYKLEGESADEKLLWRVCDIGQIDVLEELKNIIRIQLKLNKKTDADTLEKLESVGNKQGYIKSLIRDDIQEETKNIRRREWNS